MTIPQKLVSLTSTAMMRPDIREYYEGRPDSEAKVYFERRAREALAAAFSSLPECEELVVDENAGDDYQKGWNDCLAALVKMGET